MKATYSKLSHWFIGVLFMLAASLAQAASLPDFTELVEDAAPAVVNISTVKNNGGNHGPMAGIDKDDLPEIFRHFFDGRQGGTPRSQPQQSSGSGFIISQDGYILTNNHVVESADKIIVRLSDRREMEARLVGADRRTDLALLKVEAKKLPVVELGDSSKLKAGEWVLAIGSPFGFDHSVTAGIVSAVGRALPNENYVPFIQTDVAINPGNSGGPLFNLDGEVIGINSQIYTRSGGFMGLSFAIPVDVAMNVVEQLKENGRVARGWLGVMIQEVNRDLAESFGLRKPMGALVVQVSKEGPAGKGGILEGDIILEFNGTEIQRSSDLPPLVGQVHPGEKVNVQILRSGQKQTLRITIEELTDREAPTANVKKSPSVDRLGLYVIEPTVEQKQRWDIDHGVVVQQVKPGSGANSGIQRGDLLTMINGVQITDLNSYQQVLDDLEPGASVPVRVVRKGVATFIPLKVE
jgi:serine protease Do